jgi:hypothetical protein
MVCNCWVYPFLCPSHPTEKCIASSLIIYFGMKPQFSYYSLTQVFNKCLFNLMFLYESKKIHEHTLSDTLTGKVDKQNLYSAYINQKISETNSDQERMM